MSSIQNGCTLITKERARQISEENISADQDDKLVKKELIEAAITYLMCEILPDQNYINKVWWPEELDRKMFKPGTTKSNLVKAGALIAAELDRIVRQEISDE